MAGLASSPEALARSLAYLYLDMTDADLRRHLVTQARETRAALRGLVSEAIREEELVKTVKPSELARLIEAVVGGSMMSWAAAPEGPASAWMRRDLEAVLAPHLARRRKRRS
jgi:hypothetical protein